MSLSQKIYGVALRAYPPAFRQRYGVEMVRVFDEGFRDAQKAGYRSTFRYQSGFPTLRGRRTVTQNLRRRNARIVTPGLAWSVNVTGASGRKPA